MHGMFVPLQGKSWRASEQCGWSGAWWQQRARMGAAADEHGVADKAKMQCGRKRNVFESTTGAIKTKQKIEENYPDEKTAICIDNMMEIKCVCVCVLCAPHTRRQSTTDSFILGNIWYDFNIMLLLRFT